VLKKEGNIDGGIRVVAAGSVSDKYREHCDSEQQKKCCKMVFTNAAGREERRKVC
jgi:hypothetical protein